MTARTWVIVLGWAFCIGFWAAPGAGDEPAKLPGALPTAADAPTAPPAKSANDDYELYRVLVDTLDQVQRNYVQDIDRRELIEAAIKGILTKLDPYSNYISPDELGRFKTSVENQFGGIGIQIEVDHGRLKVLSPLVGTPAYRAGILAGDRIVAISDEKTEGLSIDDAVRKLKGEPGSEVTLTVVHPHNGKSLTVTLKREVIHLQTVLGDARLPNDDWDFMLDKQRHIGYIRLTAFSRETAHELSTALDKLKTLGLRGLVLDLRFNPGGLLTSAIEIADLFLPTGRIVSTSGRNSPERAWDAKKEGTYEGFPMAVLVNNYSASASEIVSASLQDHGRAVVVGERTWGKGSVQNVVELEGGKSALKLTTAGYIRPSGKNIHRLPNNDEDDEWGVRPNEGYAVELSQADMMALMQYRRQRDIARGREDLLLAHASEEGAQADGAEKPAAGQSAADATKPVENPAEEKPTADKPADKPAASGDAEEKPIGPVADRQLEVALEYLYKAMASDPALNF